MFDTACESACVRSCLCVWASEREKERKWIDKKRIFHFDCFTLSLKKGCSDQLWVERSFEDETQLLKEEREKKVFHSNWTFEVKETKASVAAVGALFSFLSMFSGENIGFPSRMIFKLRLGLVRVPIIVCNLSWQREEWNIKKLGLDKIKQKRMREDVHVCVCERERVGVRMVGCACVCVCMK